MTLIFDEEIDSQCGKYIKITIDTMRKAMTNKASGIYFKKVGK